MITGSAVDASHSGPLEIISTPENVEAVTVFLVVTTMFRMKTCIALRPSSHSVDTNFSFGFENLFFYIGTGNGSHNLLADCQKLI